MNIFILCTGRCGSTTFIKACSHMTNYSSGHETRMNELGSSRLDYPNNHIEADNRLSWFLGRMDIKYGDDAFYVHLKRNKKDTCSSFEKRIDNGIMNAYKDGIYFKLEKEVPASDIADDYHETVTSNIEIFLKDKHNIMTFNLEDAKQDFIKFWKGIGAYGDLSVALLEWDKKYNSSI